MNLLTITGNLTADPKSRTVQTANGDAYVCGFTVAVNRRRGQDSAADYFRVSCWGKQGENCMQYLAKGRKVLVTGSVSARGYTAQDGSARASLEVFADRVEFLSPRPESRPDEETYQETDEDVPW